MSPSAGSRTPTKLFIGESNPFYRNEKEGRNHLDRDDDGDYGDYDDNDGSDNNSTITVNGTDKTGSSIIVPHSNQNLVGT